MTAETVRRVWEAGGADAVHSIGEALAEFRDEWYPRNSTEAGRQVVRASVAHGFAGWALFHAYRHLAFGRAEDRGRALCLLERAVIEASQAVMPLTLFEGIAGVAWTAEHLRRIGIVDDDLIGGEIDDVLLAFLRDSSRWQNPELVAGAAGIGVYALERWPHGRSTELIATAVDVIESAAVREAGTVSWFVPHEQMSARNRRKGQEGWFDLGIAHGLTGIALFLLAASDRVDERPRIEALVRGAITFLDRRELAPDAGSRFPAFVIPAFEPQAPSRLGWCYGDLGVALLFCRAASRYEDRNLLARGIAIARDCARRESVTGVVDASLCHGAAGVAHIFHRLSQYDAELARSADEWLQRAVALRHEGGVAGFSYSYDFVDFDGSIEHNWVDNPGLLLGAAGIGLEFVTAISGAEPAWDRLFLLS